MPLFISVRLIISQVSHSADCTILRMAVAYLSETSVSVYRTWFRIPGEHHLVRNAAKLYLRMFVLWNVTCTDNCTLHVVTLLDCLKT
jgi:hypothetical protein